MHTSARIRPPNVSPHDAQERIRALPFVQADKDGLRIHDAVREAIALTLRAENPHTYREYRRAAYRHCMSELRAAALSSLWRCTADLLYLLENPVVREAFFPTGAQDYVVEPAQSQDGERILEIIERHEHPTLPLQLLVMRVRKAAGNILLIPRDFAH